MYRLGDKTPAFLLGKYQLTATLVFVSFFSVVCVLLTAPFSGNVWFELGRSYGFLLTIVFGLIALGIGIISRRLLYLLRNKGIKLWLYIVWHIVEIIVICTIYMLLTIYGDAKGIIDLHGTPVSQIYSSALQYGFGMLGVPYIIAALYFDVMDKENTIRMINYSNVVTDQPPIPQETNKIALFDNSGVLRLSVNVGSLYYFESDDNYIKVWYADECGALKQYMLRCRLRTVEESFSDSGLLRCHRKYIVNLAKIKAITKSGDGYQIDLGLEHISSIPISKTYEESILSAYNSRPRF